MRSKVVVISLVVALSAILAACGSSKPSSQGTTTSTNSSSGPTRGGTLSVLVPNGEWPNLDPALDTQDTADASLLNAIYGGLFHFGPQGQVIYDQASGYQVSNGGLTVDISIRHGLKFSDGNPFTAQDVAWSINRVLLPKNACICDADFAAVKSVTASGPYTVVLTLSRPFAPIIEAFNNTGPNWTVDEAALQKMGTTAYGQTPVGAGPFKVVHNSASSTLKLTANPTYWDAKNYPLVDNLTFTSIGSDESAYSALETGEAQIASIITTVPLVHQVEQGHGKIRVVASPATGYEFVALNEKTAPFNNILAREAIYYATNPQALVTSLYDNLYSVVESPTAQGEDFYLPTVPGYRTYDLAKAKAIVKQLGGLSVTLATTTNSQYFETEVTALQSQWRQAGIQVKLVFNNLEQTLAQLRSGSWQAIDSQWGATDPALALPFYFESNGPFTGTHDPTLDSLINKAAGITNHAQRLSLYKQIAARMNQQAEVPFLYQKPLFIFANQSVQGLSSEAFPYFETVWLKK